MKVYSICCLHVRRMSICSHSETFSFIYQIRASQIPIRTSNIKLMEMEEYKVYWNNKTWLEKFVSLRWKTRKDALFNWIASYKIFFLWNWNFNGYLDRFRGKLIWCRNGKMKIQLDQRHFPWIHCINQWRNGLFHASFGLFVLSV